MGVLHRNIFWKNRKRSTTFHGPLGTWEHFQSIFWKFSFFLLKKRSTTFHGLLGTSEHFQSKNAIFGAKNNYFFNFYLKKWKKNHKMLWKCSETKRSTTFHGPLGTWEHFQSKNAIFGANRKSIFRANFIFFHFFKEHCSSLLSIIIR